MDGEPTEDTLYPNVLLGVGLLLRFFVGLFSPALGHEFSRLADTVYLNVVFQIVLDVVIRVDHQFCMHT